MQKDSSHVHVTVRVPVSATAPTMRVTMTVVSVRMSSLGLIVVMGVLSSSSLGVIVTVVSIMRVIMASMISAIMVGLFLGDPLASPNRGLVALGSSMVGERIDTTV